MAHWHYKLCIFRSARLWFTDCTHSMCDVTRLCIMLNLNVGKGRQVMNALILAIYQRRGFKCMRFLQNWQETMHLNIRWAKILVQN